MLLTATLFAPLVGAVLVALVPASRSSRPGWWRWLASLATLALAVVLAARFRTGEAGFQLGMTAEWVPAFGVSYRVGVDGGQPAPGPAHDGAHARWPSPAPGA